MQKPIFNYLENDINSLLDYVTTEHFPREVLQDQIMNVLSETYVAINKVDEARIENDHLGKFENDRTSIQHYIDHYKELHSKACEQEDSNLQFRYGFTFQIYQSFLKNPDMALSILRIVIVGNTMFETDEELKNTYIRFYSDRDPKILANSLRNYDNKDLFLNLYKRFEGYQITRMKIIKSAGLKIFNFFDVLTKVQKTKLATHIEYLFASLGEDLKLEPKNASSIKVIGEFAGFVLFDYMRNKKGELYDFGLEEEFNQHIKKLVLMFKKQGNLAMVRRINNNRKIMEVALLARLLT